jgi:hypothetical protein
VPPSVAFSPLLIDQFEDAAKHTVLSPSGSVEVDPDRVPHAKEIERTNEERLGFATRQLVRLRRPVRRPSRAVLVEEPYVAEGEWRGLSAGVGVVAFAVSVDIHVIW